MAQFLQDFWGLLAALFGYAISTMAWAIRVEIRTKSNTENIRRIERSIEKTEDEIRTMLTEIRGDIKDLIAKTN
ncbi:MAG: hypothetical protein AAFR21_14915 [Pseudomonadota bacterium]